MASHPPPYGPEPELTEAQRNAKADAANGVPPAYEGAPLTKRERQLIDKAEDRKARGGKR